MPSIEEFQQRLMGAAEQDGVANVQYGDDAPLEARLTPDSELHKELLPKLKARREFSRTYTKDRHDEWDRVREHNRMYIDLSRNKRKADFTSDVNQVEMPFQDAVVIPLSKATLSVMLTQAMSIYGARSPMVQISPVRGEDYFRSKLMEQVLAYDNMQSKSFSTLYSGFSEAFQFGNGFFYDSWEIEEGVTYEFEPLAPEGIPPDIAAAVLGPMAFSPVRKRGVKREYQRWVPISAYNARPDPRVPLWQLQDGEFFGHKWRASKLSLLRRSGEKGPYFNIEHLSEHEVYNKDNEDKGYDPINPQEPAIAMHEGTSKQPWHNMETMVWELIPKDEKLSEETEPEKWIFTWADDKVIVRAHPLINKHQNFPYSAIEPDPDMHSTFSPGIIESIEPLQRFINWLFNSHVDNITRVLNNRYAYSPYFIEGTDLDFGGPGENIRITQEGHDALVSGEIQDIRQVLWQVPAEDVTGPSYMNAVQYVYQMAQVMVGVNDPLSGIQLPTERSATEVSTITAQATQRMAIMVRLMDENGIQPLVQRSIENRQQFTSIGRYYRIIGDLAQQVGTDSIFADLMDLQGEFDYEKVTGIVPEDPSRSATTWTNLLAAAGQIPQLQQPGPDGRILDFRQIFDTIAEKLGVPNIDQYYMQVAVQPDEQVATQVQAGNYVPVQGALPPGA
jgi:hypothetical protein